MFALLPQEGWHAQRDAVVGSCSFRAHEIQRPAGLWPAGLLSLSLPYARPSLKAAVPATVDFGAGARTSPM